jgi:hypothetical protein
MAARKDEAYKLRKAVELVNRTVLTDPVQPRTFARYVAAITKHLKLNNLHTLLDNIGEVGSRLVFPDSKLDEGDRRHDMLLAAMYGAYVVARNKDTNCKQDEDPMVLFRPRDITDVCQPLGASTNPLKPATLDMRTFLNGKYYLGGGALR